MILHHEYEVIVGEHTPAPNLYEMDYDELVALVEDVMKALRTRSYKNGYDQGRFNAEIEAAHGTYEKSDQQKRDEVVEKAKEDVETLKMRNRLSKAFTIQVIERPKSRSVEATAKVPNSRKAFYGIAKCAPNDCFNVHIGKAIALRRALGLVVPSEYLNVPQPTEVRDGDYVEHNVGNDRRVVSRAGKFPPINKPFVSLSVVEDHRSEFKIVDDSRAEGGA
ncbi:MAG: hypothetical protein ACQEUO_07510 [Bacillota bacterium]